MSITIYSKPNCVFCDKAKAMVKNLNLDYEEKMFGKDFNTVEELYEAVGKQVRTILLSLYSSPIEDAEEKYNLFSFL